MKDVRKKWNRRYRGKQSPNHPSVIVRKNYHLARKGRALDIAAGNCRNANFLSEHGFEVDALDISEVGLRLQCNENLSVNQICADLEFIDLPVSRYTLILNIKYLNRRLFPQIIDSLLPGGVLIFETFLKAEPPADTKEFFPEHLLDENELIHAFTSLSIKYYCEAAAAAAGEPYPKASLIAVKP